MIITKNKLLFKTATVTFDIAEARRMIDSGKFSSIAAVTYEKMDWPDCFEQIKTTAVIDLTPPLEDIFQKFHKTTRNEINRSGRTPSLHFVSDDKNKKVAYKMYSDFEYSQNRVPMPRSLFSKYLLFGAYSKNKLISAVTLSPALPYLRIRSIFSQRLAASNSEERKNVSFSSRRLIWEICCWGKAKNFKSLDLASVNFNNPKTANITRFKMSFGGKVINEYTYLYKTSTFLLFERLARLKNVILIYLSTRKKRCV